MAVVHTGFGACGGIVVHAGARVGDDVFGCVF